MTIACLPRWPWLLVAVVVLIPSASACSPPPPPSRPFDAVEWQGPDRVAFNLDGSSWREVDLTDGTAAAREALPWPGFGRSALAQASSPDGRLKLEPLPRERETCTTNGGMTTCTQAPYPPINSCTGEPMYTYHGVQLLRDGAPVRTWGGTTAGWWNGALWGNQTHGFVWDHDAGLLHTIQWSDGWVTDRAYDRHGALPPMVSVPPQVLADGSLVLGASGLVVLIDPGATQSVTLRSSVPAHARIDTREAQFLIVDGGALRAQAFDLLARASLWNVSVPGATSGQWAPFGLVATLADGQVVPYRGEKALPAVEGDGAPVVRVSGHGAVIGIRSDPPRLVVLGEDGDVRFDGTFQPSKSTSTGGTTSASSSTSGTAPHVPSGTSSANRADAASFAICVAALVALAVGARRRLAD